MKRANLASLLLVGCASVATSTVNGSVYKLDSSWGPLERIVQDSSLPTGVLRVTDGRTLRGDLRAWLSRDPDVRDALLAHEQVHARRQLAYPGGPPAYSRSLAEVTGFLVAEEKFGWEAQVRWLIPRGGTVDIDASAKFMEAQYDWPSAEARAWLSDLIARVRRGE